MFMEGGGCGVRLGLGWVLVVHMEHQQQEQVKTSISRLHLTPNRKQQNFYILGTILIHI